MNEIIRMTPEQANKVKKVVKKQCCNAIDGNCILLEGLDSCPCPQLITRSLICRWFLTAVLPGERELEQELIKKGERKTLRAVRKYLLLRLQPEQILRRLRREYEAPAAGGIRQKETGQRRKIELKKIRKIKAFRLPKREGQYLGIRKLKGTLLSRRRLGIESEN